MALSAYVEPQGKLGQIPRVLRCVRQNAGLGKEKDSGLSWAERVGISGQCDQLVYQRLNLGDKSDCPLLQREEVLQQFLLMEEAWLSSRPSVSHFPLILCLLLILIIAKECGPGLLLACASLL